MRITKAGLKQKLRQVDDKIMGLWVHESTRISDDDIWEEFVELLEARVELLDICVQAKVPLTREEALPQWLEKLSNSRKQIRLGELKKLHRKIHNGKKYKQYEDIFNLLEEKKK